MKKSKPTTRRSRTTYEVIKEGEFSSLLRVSLHGRFNGIRSFLNEENHPVIGESSPFCVFHAKHALLLVQEKFIFIHPKTKKRHCFSLQIPEDFRKFLRRPLSRSEIKRIKEKQSFLENNNRIES